MNITFLFGAGFSVPAELPTVAQISAKFKQTELKDKILYFSSMEWAWAEFANDAERNNGRLNGKELFEVSYILEETISFYLKQKKTELLNYEEYFGWLLEFVNKENENWNKIHESLRIELEKLAPNETLTDTLNLRSKLISCFIHLLDSLLYVRHPLEQIKPKYSAYLDIFKDTTNSINIFTLNHDLLAEILLESESIKYDDGFSNTNSKLYDDDDEKIKFFDNSFTNRTSLVKLHGGIDQYRYYYIEEANKHLGYDYYKTHDYHTKHWARHKDQNGNTIQKFSPETTPHFLTGTNKEELIRSDKMYSVLYKRFEDCIEQTEKLIIV